MRISDWSSDVCSSDLTPVQQDFLGQLGLLQPAAVELSEVGAPLVPSPWREINTMTISYGHGLAVSPLQLTAAVAAIVNGGSAVRPTLLLQDQIGRAHVCTPVTNAHLVCRLLLETKTTTTTYTQLSRPLTI